MYSIIIYHFILVFYASDVLFYKNIISAPLFASLVLFELILRSKTTRISQRRRSKVNVTRSTDASAPSRVCASYFNRRKNSFPLR